MAASKYWVWLATHKHVSPMDYMNLLYHLGSAEQVFMAEQETLERDFSLSKSATASLLDKDLQMSSWILKECDRLNVRIMTYADGDYPDRLKQLNDPPLVLYIRGKWIPLDEMMAVGIVGPRECSTYGVRVAGDFANGLARKGAVVVSGIARGVDGTALRACLVAGGFPVSVVANGVDVVYPREHAALYEDVAARGMIISEYPPGTGVKPDHFRMRNRLISGLSLGVLIVEAAERSGALITARHAVEQNRDCFVVPADIYSPTGIGTNRLLMSGAKAVISPEDIIADYYYLFPNQLRPPVHLDAKQAEIMGKAPEEKQKKTEQKEKKVDNPAGLQYISLTEAIHTAGLSDDQIAILRALENKSYTQEELVELIQISAKQVMTALTHLDLGDYVQELPMRRYTGKTGIRDE